MCMPRSAGNYLLLVQLILCWAGVVVKNKHGAERRFWASTQVLGCDGEEAEASQALFTLIFTEHVSGSSNY